MCFSGGFKAIMSFFVGVVDSIFPIKLGNFVDILLCKYIFWLNVITVCILVAIFSLKIQIKHFYILLLLAVPLIIWQLLGILSSISIYLQSLSLIFNLIFLTGSAVFIITQKRGKYD